MDWSICSHGAYIPIERKSINKKNLGSGKYYDNGGLISVEWSGRASLRN